MQNTNPNPFPILPVTEETVALIKANLFWKALEFETQLKFSSITIGVLPFPQYPAPEPIDLLPLPEPNP
jgi:hypothetical protein